MRVERRTLRLTAALGAAIAGLGLLGLCHGASRSTPAEVVAALVGAEDSVVTIRWRLPRVLAGVVFGAALGRAGAVLLQGADLPAPGAAIPVSLPVGVVSTAIGGCYLVCLLAGEVRRA